MDTTDMLLSQKNIPDLAEGEILFFTREEPLREMLAVLCGISGRAAPEAVPRLLLCDGDDPEMTDRARLAAPGAPILFLTKAPARFTPPQSAAEHRVLARPFPFDGLYRALTELLQDTPAAVPSTALKPPPSIRIEGNCAVSEGIRISLTPGEAKLLQILTDAYPAAAAKEDLAAVFARQGGNTVSVYVTYLRKKLAALPAFRGILSLHGGGFALVLHTPAADTETR